MDHVCPRCGGELFPLGGCSAHQRNWYCADENSCGWQAWDNKTNAERANIEVLKNE